MSNLTQHVEQLVKSIERAGATQIVCRAEPSMTSFVPLPECVSAARPMTAMAEEIRVLRAATVALCDDDFSILHQDEQGGFNYGNELAIQEARRELDALVNPSTPTP